MTPNKTVFTFKTCTQKSEAARFISWNDGTIDARNGVAERSKDFDYIAGYRYGQHMMAKGA